MLVKNWYYQWVSYKSFLLRKGVFYRLLSANWSFSLCDLYESFYYKLKVYLWTFQQRQEYNEQLKKELL